MNRIRSRGRSARVALASAILLPVLGAICAAPALAGSPAVHRPEDRVVRSAPVDERTPVQGSGFTAWAAAEPGFPYRYDVFVKRFDGRPIKVNGPGTTAFAGGIDGHTLVYQQSGGGRSSIRFHDLRTGVDRPAPRKVNSAAHQSGPSLSGRWLLFTRRFTEPTVWKVLLYDMDRGRVRTLQTVSGPWARYAQSGQVAGDWAAWQVCAPYCNAFVERISTGQRWMAPNPEHRFQYAPSVRDDGTMFFARSSAACGNVTLMRFRPGSDPVPVIVLANDLSTTYTSRDSSGRTVILYDATRCTDYLADIHRISI
ncbi:MAG TPA: hypothetical protein VGB19_04625 [Actinomycetota bacterium]